MNEFRVDKEECEGIDVFGCEDNPSEQIRSSSIEPGPTDKATVL